MPLLHLSTLFLSIIEALFPSKCIGCRQQGPELCNACLSGARRLEIEGTGDAVVPFPYQDPLIGNALRTLKYRNRKSIGRALGAALYEPVLFRISEEASWEPGTTPAWTIVPIPLSAKRHKERGFNQCELIAHGLIESAGPGIFSLEPGLLVRHKQTASQVSQPNRTARMRNVAGCFRAPNPEAVSGKRILLLDDTRTTGASLTEACKTLQLAGAHRIVCCAVAQQE